MRIACEVVFLDKFPINTNMLACGGDCGDWVLSLRERVLPHRVMRIVNKYMRRATISSQFDSVLGFGRIPLVFIHKKYFFVCVCVGLL